MGYNKDMFFKAFKKIAMMTSAISPEHYYELETDKYPHAGANAGALAGALAGAYKGSKGKKSDAALVGAALGAGTGAVAGHLAGRAVKSYKLNRLTRAAEEMRLRSTPSRRHSHEE
jgi:uncharacterized membrane protein YebE (DUF533 family)